MIPEVSKRRPATIVRRELATAVMPTHIIRGETEVEVLKELGKLSRRGYVGATSGMVQFRTGGYGVKVELIKPLPQPMPGWAKGCALVGAVLMACSAVGLLVLHAVQSTFTAAAALPWTTILGGLAVLAVLVLITPVGRKCCTVVVSVWH